MTLPALPIFTVRLGGRRLLAATLSVLVAGLAGLAGAVVSGLAQAGNTGMADPTRPPAGYQRAAAGSEAAPRLARPAATAASGNSAAAAPVAAEPLPLLQGLQVSGSGVATAMVDGRLVRSGDTVAGRRVLSIDASGVALQGGAGIERLRLLAGPAKLPAGSIRLSQSTRFTAAPARGGVTDTASATAGAAADPYRAVPTAPSSDDNPTDTATADAATAQATTPRTPGSPR